MIQLQVFEQVQSKREDRVYYQEPITVTVTKGGKAHLRVLQLNKVLSEQDVEGGLVKIEYLRGVKQII